MSGPDNLTATGMWTRHLGAVDTFTPGLADDEREIRARLMLARDLALGRMREATADSAELWQSIYSIASRWVFTAAPLDRLQSVRAALVRVALQANALEWRVDHDAL